MLSSNVVMNQKMSDRHGHGDNDSLIQLPDPEIEKPPAVKSKWGPEANLIRHISPKVTN